MKSFFRSFLASLTALLLLVGIVAGFGYIKLNETTDIEDDSYLVIDLYGDVTEYAPPGDLMSQVSGGGETLHRILGNLDKARVDDRIEGVIFKFSSSNGLGPAMMEEIRCAVREVQAAGKPVLGFADSMDRGTYYLACACDSLYTPPSAYIEFTGFGLEMPFVKNALEKLGIQPRLHRIKDYKAAAELITRTEMSGPARENDEWILDEFWRGYVATLETDRGLDEAAVMAVMEHVYFQPEEAVAAGLFDRILYWDELEAMLKGEDDDRLLTVCQERYAEEDPEDLGLGGDEKIAVVHAFGTIGGRASRTDPLLGVMMGHETVVADLRRARLDEDVKAIIFRVDSGGGESLASDLIGHEIEVCAGVKPTIVSMVDVAASGGYSISYRATKLVADETSIVGSIGSISGKFITKDLFDRLGITWDAVSRGPNALIDSDKHDFTEAQWERFVEDHWAGFNVWLRDVAEHRGLSFEEAELLAHGRVFTGGQSLDNGLIDAVGGLDKAVELAKELADIPAEDQVTLLHYPEAGDLLDSVFGGGGGDATAALESALALRLRRDLNETRHLVMQRHWQMMDAGWIE